jgi:hypothetical protein
VIEVGQSELADFRQCPLKHKFRWRDGWHLPVTHVEANTKSTIGTQWHHVQAAHYRAKQVTESAGEVYTVERASEIMKAAIEEIIDLYEMDNESGEERRALLTWMAEGYLERYGVDPDWEIVAVEKRLSVPIADPDDRKSAPEFALRFTADLIVRLRSLGRLVIVDNKTVESQGAQGTFDVDLDDQLGIYTRGYSRMDPKDPPIYAMLNQVRRDKLKRPMLLTERFMRPKSTRTQRELDEIERDALSDLRRMHGKENLARPSSAPNPKQCAWKCDFKEAHIALRRSGGDWDEARRVITARGMSNDHSTDPALANR